MVIKVGAGGHAESRRVAIIALPMFSNLKGTYLTTGVEKGVWRQKGK